MWSPAGRINGYFHNWLTQKLAGRKQGGDIADYCTRTTVYTDCSALFHGGNTIKRERFFARWLHKKTLAGRFGWVDRLKMDMGSWTNGCCGTVGGGGILVCFTLPWLAGEQNCTPSLLRKVVYFGGILWACNLVCWNVFATMVFLPWLKKAWCIAYAVVKRKGCFVTVCQVMQGYYFIAMSSYQG